MIMKISNTALVKINELETRLKLALLFKVGERRVQQIIESNKENGPLTTAGALAIIRAETKLKDKEILEEVPERARA
jgi:hypothetical protein